MGNFYTNFTLRGPSQRAVADALAGRSAIVTREQNGCVVAYDEESDNQSQEVISGLASHLSRELNCPVWAVLNHDDDILWYQLYLGGDLTDEYDSTPGYFDSSWTEASLPTGGDARKLCDAFGSARMAELEDVLRKPALGDDGYIFALMRHEKMADILNIPAFGVGVGFSYVDAGELPEGLEERDLLRVE